MLELKNVHKQYRMGDSIVNALQGVSLKIEDGEFVAIMGPSGSGKSTLMHILGLLDTPDSGSYLLNGKEVARMKGDELAVLRREAIGFIFQQFNLLPRMSAAENVALPSLYSKGRFDLDRASTLLAQVGLGQRVHHKSNELSGGQQQRVAIARSLINQPGMILADEPTGNLDSKSEKEIIATLQDLNKQGITVVLVTHEEEIGCQARRLIRIRDGRVHSDERLAPEPVLTSNKPGRNTLPASRDRFQLSDIWEYFRQGLRTLGANKVRTGLSMLGILIGVAAVVAMLAVGQGAQKSIEKELSSLGSNLLILSPGRARVGGVTQEGGATNRLTIDDVNVIKEMIPSVKNASPAVQSRGQITYSNKNWNTQVLGASPSYATVHMSVPDVGRFFTEDENQRRMRLAVIGTTIVRELFGGRNPIGEILKINKVNFQVIGVLPHKGASGWRDQDDIVIVPVMTAMYRLMGRDHVDYVDVEVRSPEETDSTQQSLLDLMLSRHKVPLSQQDDAFMVRNTADLQNAVSQTSRTLSMLLASIAAISLLVGGIGIMNIMLVSVTERTREIGLRKAVGAKRWDILFQFLIESIVISFMGGLLGIALAWLITKALSSFAGWATSITVPSVLLAFVFSVTIGIVFGIYPARKASLLNPIEALRYE